MKKTFNGSFKRKTEIAQYNAALMISSAIKGTSCGVVDFTKSFA